MVTKVLAGVLLAVVFAAVSTLGVVYYSDYSSPSTEPATTPCSHSSSCPLSIADTPSCCDDPIVSPAKCTQAPVDASK
jgi:hypothetical protein